MKIVSSIDRMLRLIYLPVYTGNLVQYPRNYVGIRSSYARRIGSVNNPYGVRNQFKVLN